MAEMIARENHRLLEARLLISRPEDVFNELKQHGSQAESSWSLDAWDQQLERNLLARNEPLIDLALARYATDEKVVGSLYEKACTIADTSSEAYNTGLRIACLSNHLVLMSDIAGFPQNVIGAEATWKVLREAGDDEASALLHNPRIDSNLLESLYMRDGLFASLPDKRWLRLVLMSKANPRVNRASQSDSYGLDHDHRRIHMAIFKMLDVAPTSYREALFWFYYKLNPSVVARPVSISHVLERWSLSTDGNIQRESLRRSYLARPRAWYEDAKEGVHLSPSDDFRCLIAALYGRRDKAVLKDGSSSSDVAIRCAYYAGAYLSLDEMEAGHERDGDLFEFAVLCNDHILLSPVKRNALEQRYLSDKERYRGRCEYLHQQQPSFDLRPVDERLEDERRKGLEREIAQYRYLVLGGVSVLVGWAAIQGFHRSVNQYGLLPASFVIAALGLIGCFAYGSRFDEKLAAVSGRAFFGLFLAFWVYLGGRAFGGSDFWSHLVNSALGYVKPLGDWAWRTFWLNCAGCKVLMGSGQ